MPIEKVNSTNPIPSVISKNEPEQKVKTETDKSDKKMSDAAKYMIGATILAATVAIGVIGHKNNWWRKAAQEGENITSHHESPRPAGPRPSGSADVPPDEQALERGLERETETPISLPYKNSEPIINISEIKTTEAAAAEFERVAGREIQGLASSKAIIDEASAEILEFAGKNPAEVLKAKNLAFEISHSGTAYTILNDKGQPIKRLIFNTPAEYIGKSYSRPYIIEHINPETGKFTKIIHQDEEIFWSVRMFDESGEHFTKELFVNRELQNRPLLITKNYSNKNIVPDTVTVFNTADNKMEAFLEYDVETGYPKVAYFKENIYNPREFNSQYFDNIVDSVNDFKKVTDFHEFYGVGTIRELDFILPRYTKSGYIVENGNVNGFGDELTLLDPVTRNPKYYLKVDADKDITVREFDPKTNEQLASLLTINGELLGNSFKKSPKEVLEEMKEIFTDLTPSLYQEAVTKTPELIEEVIAKLA